MIYCYLGGQCMDAFDLLNHLYEATEMLRNYGEKFS